MQINQLPTIPQAPADADVLAIEVNGITYKVSKQALAAAIAANITPADIGALPSSTTFVSGVKGGKESSYRSGNVNLTPTNIGALPDTTTAADIGALPATTTAADIGAMLNLSITNADVANATALYNKLSQIPYSTEPSVRGAAAGYIGQTPMRIITGISTASYGWGYIIRNGVNDFRFFVATSTGGVCYAFTLTASESDYSCGTVYKYTGE